MLGRFARFLLALTALAPAALVWTVVDAERNGLGRRHMLALILCGFLAGICWLLFYLAERHVTRNSFAAVEVRAVDNETVAFVVTYLFPLLTPTGAVGPWSLGIIGLILAVILTATNAFTFNPLIAFLGYRFYEVKSPAGITYLLVSKGDIRSVKCIKKAGELSSHLLIHTE